jgi:hypothetical protein
MPVICIADRFSTMARGRAGDPDAAAARANKRRLPPRWRKAFLEAVLEERVVSSRNRRNPRGVKRKMSNSLFGPSTSHPCPH